MSLKLLQTCLFFRTFVKAIINSSLAVRLWVCSKRLLVGKITRILHTMYINIIITQLTKCTCHILVRSKYSKSIYGQMK